MGDAEDARIANDSGVLQAAADRIYRCAMFDNEIGGVLRRPRSGDFALERKHADETDHGDDDQH
jgi:hypothetical protein